MPDQSKNQLRIRVFVDFWNFTLSLRKLDEHFKIDWRVLGASLSAEAGKTIDPGALAIYEGAHVYGSYDPNSLKDVKLKNWFANTLDKMAGVNVVALPRQRKRGYPRCPHCQVEAMLCASCDGDMRGTEEKGVDTRMATDMISLAWADGFNVAVLISSDRDFVPVAEFLQTKGIKVVHGAFPPAGSHLSQKCWAHIDLPAMRHRFSRI